MLTSCLTWRAALNRIRPSRASKASAYFFAHLLLLLDSQLFKAWLDLRSDDLRFNTRLKRVEDQTMLLRAARNPNLNPPIRSYISLSALSCPIKTRQPRSKLSELQCSLRLHASSSSTRTVVEASASCAADENFRRLVFRLIAPSRTHC